MTAGWAPAALSLAKERSGGLGRESANEETRGAGEVIHIRWRDRGENPPLDDDPNRGRSDAGEMDEREPILHAASQDFVG